MWYVGSLYKVWFELISVKFQLGITDDLGDAIFKQGMLADASAGVQGLGDPGVVTGTSVDPDWDPRFKEEIDFLILITGDSPSTISERLHQIERILTRSFKVIIQLEGVVRPGVEKGHEHFGFKDCLSQPRVAGFTTPNTGEVPTRKLFSLRFQNIVVYTFYIEPGVIVVGQTGDGVTRPDWTKDGSFLAFRQLKQLVPEFNKFLADNPIADPGLTQEQGSDLLGACLRCV
jgi:deferrochelatase/peroxidase EfeB